MNFASDNWAGADPAVVAAVAEAAEAGGPAYGGDPLTRAVERKFSDLFERDVAVFFVATGTAANSLALSAYGRPGGAVIAHRDAHINVDEAGGTEFLAGLKIVGVGGARGKIAPVDLEEAFARFSPESVQHGRPVAVSLTQMTELGAVYRSEEIGALAEIAHRRGAAVHMDGARFGSAVARLGAPPADITWRAGIDVLSFGATKNGCLAADAVVFFDLAKADDFRFIRQRSGHTFSKSWFVAAQFHAYLEDGRWLRLAGHANDMARRLARVLDRSSRARLAAEPDGNEVFAILDGDAHRDLKAAGAAYYEWPWKSIGLRPDANQVAVRLVTSFRTTTEDVARFAEVLS
jgi:threonine aldolase